MSSVKDMRKMFDGEIALKRTIESWDIPGVIDMSYTFRVAASFNQDIGSLMLSVQ
jgi:hypothetical protein